MIAYARAMAPPADAEDAVAEANAVTDHGPGTAALASVEYEAYELLPADATDRALTLGGAHSGARVVRSRAEYAAAEKRLVRAG